LVIRSMLAMETLAMLVMFDREKLVTGMLELEVGSPGSHLG
jgi:hypothetical protein